MKKNKIYILIFLLSLWQAGAFAQDRFPRPEFETEYNYPVNNLPAQRAPVWEYFDVFILVAALSVTAWFAIKKRSRKGLIWMSVFSLAYFGFFRQGCICAVGSVQNVALSLFNTGYAIPLTALLFFIIPLVFALLYGRVFCAGVCPLGAIQELTGIRPLKISKGSQVILSSVPFIYLAVAVLFAALDSRFLICSYDPFIGIFRMDGPYIIITFGVLLLLAGVFVSRPYCRFLCPYGVLMNIFSRFSGKHLSITPSACNNCRLCEGACPYDAILPASDPNETVHIDKSRKNFLVVLILIPLIAAAFGFTFYRLSPALAGINKNVMLAREIRQEKETGLTSESKAAVAFRESGKTEEQLFHDEEVILKRFRKASPWAGIFLGISLGIGLLSLSVHVKRDEYRPDKAKCFSCGRCFRYCPVKVKN
jgi:polyferredoxin